MLRTRRILRSEKILHCQILSARGYVSAVIESKESELMTHLVLKLFCLLVWICMLRKSLKVPTLVHIEGAIGYYLIII
jgi:hypothetical protein